MSDYTQREASAGNDRCVSQFGCGTPYTMYRRAFSTACD